MVGLCVLVHPWRAGGRSEEARDAGNHDAGVKTEEWSVEGNGAQDPVAEGG